MQEGEGTRGLVPNRGVLGSVTVPSLRCRAHPSHLTSVPALSSPFPGIPLLLFDFLAAHFKSNPLRRGRKTPPVRSLRDPQTSGSGVKWTSLLLPSPGPSERLLCFVMGLREPCALPTPVSRRARPLSPLSPLFWSAAAAGSELSVRRRREPGTARA